MLRSVIRSLRGVPRRCNVAIETITHDGAWSWFADPRAVRFQRLRDCIYVGYVTSTGDIRITQVDSDTGLSVSATLHFGLDVNDHANPALAIDAEGRVTVFYSAHNGDAMYSRTTVNGEDITEWHEESRLAPNRGDRGRDSYTYPNPAALSEDGSLLLLWRGDGWKPTISRSTDGGGTWDPPSTLVAGQDADDTNRPYVKVAVSGEWMHVAFTDGHPQVEESNSIYYVGYRDGQFVSADGGVIASEDELPLDSSTADCVYDAETLGARAWVWDVACDESGMPAVAFSVFPTEAEHEYYYGRWSGSAWSVHRIVTGGRWFPQDADDGSPQREPYYSGGAVLDHENVNVVYISRPIRGTFEIERWETITHGHTWSSVAITSESSHDNVRPVAIRNHDALGPQAVWMQIDGSYIHYSEFQTSIRMASFVRR